MGCPLSDDSRSDRDTSMAKGQSPYYMAFIRRQDDLVLFAGSTIDGMARKRSKVPEVLEDCIPGPAQDKETLV